MEGKRTWSNLFGLRRTAKNENAGNNKKKRIYHRIKKIRQYHANMEMDTLGNAVDSANDTENPNYEDLYSLYSQAEKDRHLKSQVDIAINDVQQSPFVIEVGGNEDEELKNLFDAAWFDDYIQYATEAEFWGHSLIEFPPVNEEQVFDGCFLLPRENVDPARQRIIINKDDELFLAYAEKMGALNLVEIKGKEVLGLFELTTEEVILKKYARTDWSQASERYGMPFLKYATDTSDKKELDAIEEGCANFAANGYIICGTDDEIDIMQPSKGDFYKIYLEAIALGNSELSKCVNGQTGSSDNQAYVGTAEVQERVKNTFTKARLRRVQNHINGKLIPLMVANSYKDAAKLVNAKLRYTDLMDTDPKLTTKQGEEPGGPDNGSGGPQARLQKKKLKRYFPVAAGGLFDPESFNETFAGYIGQVNKGTGIDLKKTSYTDARFELYNNLHADASRFAAFREAQKTRELNAARTGIAKAGIEKRYKEYFATEKHAIFGNSAAAERWAGFNENADLYPNLEWRTAGDSDVRDEHARLDGLVLPINDSFWNSHTPPLGWGCRCELTQTDKTAKKKEGYKNTTAPKGFDFNPGKEQKLFANSAGYYTSANTKEAASITKEANRMLYKQSRLFGKKQAGGKFKTNIGEVIVTKPGIKEIINQPHENYVAKNMLVKNIKGLLKSVELKPATNIKSNPMVEQYYYGEFVLFGKKARVVVREMKNGEKILYSITDSKTKK